MATWTEEVAALPGPRYLAIAKSVASAIGRGQIEPGDTLPPHRDLALTLKVNVSTVTRAYTEMKRRGLVVGEVGRGTFVAKQVPDAPPTIWDLPADWRFIDLSHNFPARAPLNAEFSAFTDKVLRRQHSRELMRYQVDWGLRTHRAAGAAWLRNSALPARTDEVVVTAGAQHGIFLAISALARPGDVVMTEEMTFYGFKSAAALLGLTVAGIRMDGQGLIPEALEEVCRRTDAKLLYCTPTLHNPTTSIMSAKRRPEVAEICARHDVTIVEDDVYGFLLRPRLPPLAQFAPDRSVYVTSLSKCINPGLRIGYLYARPPNLARIRVALRATILMATPLMAEVAAQVIRSGAAERIAESQRREMQRRHAASDSILPGHLATSHPNSFHTWLRLKNGWSARQFARAAERRKVGVTPADIFSVTSQEEIAAVRICVSAAHDVSQLRQALHTLAGLIEEHPQDETPFV